MTVTVDRLGAELAGPCSLVWIVSDGDEWDCLMATTMAVESYLSGRQIPPGTISPVEIAIAALDLTPAELQSFTRWCPGHGDEEDCEVDPSNPCRACVHEGWRQASA